MTNKIKIAFFGSSRFSIFCLEELKILNLIPSLIITSPDKPQGRKLKLEPNSVKLWAIENKIEFLTPAKLDSDFLKVLSSKFYDLFLVASYGKIIPKNILALPKYGALNVHPSLLPKYRGPSPLQTQILNSEQNIGVSVMLMDEQVDHGSLVAQEKITIENWPVNFIELEKITAKAGAELFTKILPDWLENKIIPKEQDHSEATFTKKVEKNDGELDIINGDPYKNYLKTLAYYPWPGTFFFVVKHHLPSPTRDSSLEKAEKGEGKIRVIIKDSEYKDGVFIIKRVLPEGKKKMNYEDFLRGLR